MGCQQSKRAGDVAAGAHSPVMRPSTPSFQPRESLAARSSAGPGGDVPHGAELEELPSFVLSTTSDLIKSSDSEAVQGMVSAFTFSFIQVSEASVSSSSGLDSSSSASASDDDKQSEADGDTGDSATDQMPPIPEEVADHKDEHEEAKTDCGDRAQSDAGTLPETNVPIDATSAVSDIVGDLVASSVRTAVAARDHASRLSVATNESDDVKEYVVTETGDVRVALDVAIEKEPDTMTLDPATATEAVDPTAAIVAAIIDEVVESAISNAANAAVQPESESRDDAVPLTEETGTARDLLSKGYSTLTNPSSTELNVHSTSTFDVIDESSHGAESSWMYAVVGSSVSADGIVLYHVQLTDGTTSKWSTPVMKRYSEFKQLRSTLKASGVEVTADFPPLPRAGLTQLIRGKLSKRTIAQREQQFTAILRFITQHRGLEDSAVFRTFIAQ